MFKTMNCTRVEKFLPLYVADDLTGRRRKRAVENHLAACERCHRAAAEYHASRELFRASALPSDFDDAFYEEIRNSVLARVASDRTLAPPRALPGIFDMRLAYAASLALLFVVAALSLHSYMRRAPEEGARPKTIANAKHERPAIPATIKTQPASRPDANDRQTPPTAREATGAERRAKSKSSPQVPRENIERAGNKATTVAPGERRTPLHGGRNPRAPIVAATARANVVEMAAATTGLGETNTRPEVSRIEIQTSDPNIRIIWLSPVAEDAARPLK